jgi:hypothetical protein
MDIVLLDSLRGLAANDALARRAFEILAQRQRRRTELTVEVLMRDMGVPRGDVVKFFKLLDELGYGKFFAGRGSKQSRFRWRYAMYSVAQVALGQSQTLEELPWDGNDEVEEPTNSMTPDVATPTGSDAVPAPAAATLTTSVTRSRLINHTYPLRPDLLAPIGLPADLTAQEAERLAAFIRALAVTPPV